MRKLGGLCAQADVELAALVHAVLEGGVVRECEGVAGKVEVARGPGEGRGEEG